VTLLMFVAYPLTARTPTGGAATLRATPAVIEQTL
jgi:hypothetical protein